MSNVRIFLLVFFCSVLISNLTGQRVLNDGNWEAVILYNRVPFLVKMTPEGKILDFQKELPKNYNALQKFIEEEFGGEQNIYVFNEGAIAETKQVEELSDELDPHKRIKEETDNVQMGKEEESKYALDELVEETPLESEMKTRESYNFNLVYPGQVAIFNKGQLGRLDEIIRIMKTNTDLKLTMEAFASDRSNVSVTVNQNRLQGIEDYLSFRGIGLERINNNGMSIKASKSNTIRIILD